MPPEVKAGYLAYRAAYDPRPIATGPFVSARDVAGAIRDARAARAPLSVVRLGDGEGCGLFWGIEGFGAVGDFIWARQMSNQFGPRAWSADEMAALQAELWRAVEGADIVTAARRPQLHARLVAEAPNAVRDIRGFIGATFVPHAFTAASLPARRRIYPETWLHVALEPMMPDLCAGAELVAVSCRGAAFHAGLARVLGARLAGEVHVPGADESGDLVGAPLYPDALHRVRAEVMAAAGPGVVILIAAGICAKALCVDAAARGAVALDVGSMMDVWAGKGVRAYHDDGFVAARRVQAGGAQS